MDDMKTQEGIDPLWERMREYALLHGAPREDWGDLADKLEAAARGFYLAPAGQQTHTVQQFLGCFARARRAWCDVTGEPLVGRD